jgi:hypothetical protein
MAHDIEVKMTTNKRHLRQRRSPILRHAGEMLTGMIAGWHHPALGLQWGHSVLRPPAFMAAAISTVIRASYILIGGSADRKPRRADRRAVSPFPHGDPQTVKFARAAYLCRSIAGMYLVSPRFVAKQATTSNREEE